MKRFSISGGKNKLKWHWATTVYGKNVKVNGTTPIEGNLTIIYQYYRCIYLPLDPAVLLLGIPPIICVLIIKWHIYRLLFAALFIYQQKIENNPVLAEWLNQLWQRHQVEYYATNCKKNKEPFGALLWKNKCRVMCSNLLW